MSSTTYAIVTAVGPDRPGLVKAISGAIHRAGCNLEDSRMAILAGEFALIMLLSGSDQAIERVKTAVGGLERELDFRIALKPTAPPHQRAMLPLYRLRVTGPDQPGIVHAVGEALSGLQVNVASLESRLIHAAFSGTPIFSLLAELQLPNSDLVDQLAIDLELVCDEMGLHFELDSIDKSTTQDVR